MRLLHSVYQSVLIIADITNGFLVVFVIISLCHDGAVY